MPQQAATAFGGDQPASQGRSGAPFQAGRIGGAAVLTRRGARLARSAHYRIHADGVSGQIHQIAAIVPFQSASQLAPRARFVAVLHRRPGHDTSRLIGGVAGRDRLPEHLAPDQSLDQISGDKPVLQGRIGAELVANQTRCQLSALFDAGDNDGAGGMPLQPQFEGGLYVLISEGTRLARVIA